MSLTNDNPPIVHEVTEITEEVYEDSEQEAIDTGSVVIVNVVSTPDPDVEEEPEVIRE